MAEDQTIFEISGFDKLLKTLNAKLPEIKIGVVRDSRRGGDLTNSDIGTFHEYGTPKIPRRSFLVDPLIDNMQTELERSGYLEKDALRQAMADRSLDDIAKHIGIIAEQVVIEAFDTGGNGKWQAPKKPNKKGMLLDDTGQLRRSIGSVVD